jgi:hypothetical protein
MTDELIYSAPDVLGLLDDLLTGGGGPWWNEFWADRARAPDGSSTPFDVAGYDP